MKKKYRPNEIWKMQAENKFVVNTIGWKPKISFEEGLKNSVEWYRDFLEAYFGKK